MNSGRTLATVAAGAVATGALALGYAGLEAKAYTVRRVSVPVLAAGSRPIRVLHLSDLHLLPTQHAKLRFLSELAALEPDLVVNTGDNHAHPDAHPVLLDALGRLLDVPGVFVHGSNDYYSPRPRNWLRYLRRHTGGADAPAPEEQRELPWRDLDAGFLASGWRCLDNTETVLDVGGQRILLRGTDDPHLELDRYDVVAGGREPDGVTLRIGVTHAPYLRVLDAMIDDGMQLILAGHTHGGQVCVPGYGALVSNCDLDTGRASGLSTHSDGRHAARLHVSAGLGTSPYAPIRFACRPEVTLLTLTAP